MLPDEVLRLGREKCIALLYKLAPEELPDYKTLKARRVAGCR